MKKRKAKRLAPPEPITIVFARGLLATAFVEMAVAPRANGSVLARRAVQGGVALAAGTAAAFALGRRDWTGAVTAVAAGAAGMAAAQMLFDAVRPPGPSIADQENDFVQA